jgi:arylsulfatase A-like enzyme
MVLAVVFVAACRSDVAPAGDPVRIDLARLFRVSDAGPRTTAIDVTAPENPHQLLWGWGAPTTAPDGTRAVPIEGAQAALTFRAGSVPGPMTLVVDRVLVEPPGPHLRPEGVRVVVNGQYAGRLVPHRARIEVPLPPRVLKRGRNLLTLRLIKRPREDPKRPSAVFLYRRLEFHAAHPPIPEPALDGVEAITFPPGTVASFFLRAPQAARFRATLGGAGATLRVRAQGDGEQPRVVAEIPSPGDADVALDVAPAGIVRIDLAVDGAALQVMRPRIDGTRQPPPAAPPLDRGPPRNVLLYVIDTLRADRLGLYGAARPTTPHLDRFAGQAIVFERAMAQSSWTRPSVASVLTGLHPFAHGAVAIGDRVGAHARLLPEVFAAHGYETKALVTNANVSEPFGFARGFARFDYLSEDADRAGVHVPARLLHDDVLAWLDTRGRRPFFLYVHASDPHAPYHPSSAAAARFVRPGLASTIDPAAPLRGLHERRRSLTADDFEHLRSLYEAEVADLDAELGRLFDELAARGVLDDTIVVVVADHGEEFGDHGGIEHGTSLYQELVHVPLLVRLPGGRGARTRVVAQHVDLLPTLLSLVGLPVPSGLPGRVLLAADGRVTSDDDVEVLSTTWFGRTALTSLVVPPWKVILPERGDAPIQLFDLDRDPHERMDLAAAHPVVVGYATQRVAEIEAAWEHLPRARAVPLDPATRDRLRQLGYLVE